VTVRRPARPASSSWTLGHGLPARQASDLVVVTSNASADFLSPPGVPPWVERRAAYVAALRIAGG
jgi:hypothetical protein